MKAVIVELKVHNAAALTNDGCIIKIKNKNYAIGQVIELKTPITGKRTKITIWAASAAAVVMLFGVTAWAYFTPYTYVSLDVNPSIEYAVNRFDTVLSATAVNDDGTEILANLDLINKPIEEAIKETVNQIAQDGYFEGQDPGGVMISTSSENQQDAQQLAQNLQTSVQEVIADNAAPIEVEAVSVGLARITEARKLGTTPGKLNLVQKLQASAQSTDSINVEEWINKPVKEIMKAIKVNKNDTKDVKQQNKNKEQQTHASSAAGSAVTSSASSAAEQADTSKVESESSSKSTNSSTLNATKKQSVASVKANESKIAENQNESNSESAASKVTGKPETNNAEKSNGKSNEKAKSNH